MAHKFINEINPGETIDDIYMYLPSPYVEPDVWDYMRWARELGIS